MDLNHLFSENIKQALMITSFVMVMMLIIEFINVFSKGRFSYRFKKNTILQIILASVLGAIPGCLGTYAAVSLFTHHVIGFGALLAAMIATTGDETFIMLTMIPKTGMLVVIILFIMAVIAGIIFHLSLKSKSKSVVDEKIGFSVHKEEKNECVSIKFKAIYNNFRFISFKRALLIVTLSIFIIGLSLGEFGNFHGLVEIQGGEHVHEGHDHSAWIPISFLILSVTALLVSILATNHFLEHHLWNHIIKVHFLRIFLWTFGTLIFISVLAQNIDMGKWMESNKFLILLMAILIGVIPASGPHIIFITLFFNGTVPLAILLANSIVQDGHGALPLFAESKKHFFLIKSIKVFLALVVGTAMIITVQ